ncbi:bifunctional diaminohydroxyphosphoribosylaminopyrimidine deaminase/5-amino-6-(5-phosphoribosylamino)uracil reductase RibD [Catenovulum sp. 2E275]|uniref:bifunctional diaminohydroxyphosphoribosylaminopyrimidine deaminase/5-amino-6-(5-phosphoribosylamino)uracil reductase RibD n=1 Tax=Catenovulum sp. 2E275 TaxID=2980497 RepID=UPI0021D09F57|nr:bifunctional diaminohydroxyphosphoribosylaminopyrimidine deaminase/5-amino-6-(5-phosphoribosylamino)uracil reductase RibD [Catenovulum sp. 2E275]MCU4676165.1 bifunctional diaminohydroxyphosphoribosylaminopyrimidine deaminase/5-amino-6-(5-phosphoribosylamino)uracil reductase RibD [Catenovulum sp. 2E275]
MSAFYPDDLKYMARAIKLAEKGRYTTSPNPCVGCVIVKHGQIIGEGFHIQAGGPHAEINALNQVKANGESPEGATAYVTLEPCSHTGKTPPCANALINAKVAKVIVGMEDPNPLVSGRGIEMLRDAGIAVHAGCLEDACQKINPGFNQRMNHKRPFVQLKLAASLDGRTAMASGESKWITSYQARKDVQNYRAQACAILTGSGTVLADNPSLNVRESDFYQPDYPADKLRQPVKIVIDNQAKITPDLNIFNDNACVYLVGNKQQRYAAEHNWSENTHFIHLNGESNKVDLTAVMAELAKLQINQIWVEAGAKLAGALIKQNLVDELIIYQAPKLLGENTKGLLDIADLTELNQAIEWQYKDVRQIGPDLRITLRAK